MSALRVLFVEDSEDDVAMLIRELRKGSYKVQPGRVETRDDLRQALAREEWDIVISDYSMPSFDGAEALAISAMLAPEVPFLLISGTVGEQLAVDSIKAGASDYLMKDNLIRFVPAVGRAIREAAERRSRQAALAELHESKEMLSLIYNNTSDWLALFELMPDGVFRIASVNQPCHKFIESHFGASPARMSSFDIAEFTHAMFGRHPDLSARQSALLERVVRTRTPATEETEIQLAGRLLHIEQSLIPVEQSDHPKCLHVLWVGRDVTQRREAHDGQRRLEAQLQQARKLEALGKLAGGIAHDFNNLLTSILGFGELARGEVRDVPVVAGYLEQMLGASLRARDLVRQILAFSQQQPIDTSPIDLTRIAAEVAQLLHPLAHAGVSVVTALSAECPAVLGNATQLHQVLMNLCTNSVQAIGPRPGSIELRVEAVYLGDEFCSAHPPLRPGQNVRITVTDTGPGIPAEAIERLFEPFFTTKARGEGTGLGLAVVHGVVKGHGGAIEVESTLGQGTCFTIHLPATDGPAHPPSGIADFIPHGNGERILYVDDEESIVQLGIHILEQLGYVPVPSTNPVEALEAFRAAPDTFAAAITDLSMPTMLGNEFARHLVQIRPGFPVILTSGYYGDLGEAEARDLGFFEIIGKPFLMRSVAQVLERALKVRYHEDR